MMNPMTIIQQFFKGNSNLANNPTMQNAMQMMQNNDVGGLQKIAENMCKQRGLNLSDVQKQIMNRFGMK